jgi:drug/metabolite transporter (DMT)-like permease
MWTIARIQELTMANRTNEGLLPGLVFTFLCFVWGSTWLAIKVGLGSLPPITFAGIRFVLASGLLGSYAIAKRIEFPRDAGSWRVMLFLSLSQIAVPYALAFWGEQYMTAGLTSLLFATLPFFVVVFAHFMIPGERVTARKVSAMLLCFIGVAVIFSRELMFTVNSFWGGIAVVASAGIAGCANVVGKKYSESINSTVNVVVQMGVGSIVLVAAGLFLERGLPLNFGYASVFAIVYLAVLGSTFAFVALYWLFTRMEVTRISLFTFITPIVAVLLGWLILGESVDINVVAGGSLILVGVMLLSRVPATG